MSKKATIMQSIYLPWKGYFDIISRVDEFIILDNVQYTKRDWRNRNLIKTPTGLAWLTIPVKTKGKYTQKISEVEVLDKNWAASHWQIIKHNYSKSEYFGDYEEKFEKVYKEIAEEKYLSNINRKLIELICDILNIRTKISWSTEYDITNGKTDKLISLLKQIEASIYLTNPNAEAYIDKEMFAKKGIKLCFMNYNNYPEYKQVYGIFEHKVSVIDLIFNTGHQARKYIHSEFEF